MIPCNKYRCIFILSLLLSIGIIEVFGQVPVVRTPQQATVLHNVIVGNSNNRNNPVSNIPVFPTTNNRNQQQLNMYEQDRLTVEHIGMAQKQNQFEDELASYSSIQFDLPSWSGIQGTEHYYQTAEKLLDMLNGKTPLNLKEAVFAVENAYFEAQVSEQLVNFSILQFQFPCL